MIEGNKKIKIKFNVSDSTYSQIKKVLDKLEEFDFIESKYPDFVIFDETAGAEAFRCDDCVRIQWSPELIYPDFNITDYAIGNNYIEYEDRYFREPLFLLPTNREKVKRILEAEQEGKLQTITKDKFCNFIYSNKYGDNARQAFFEKLNKYKFVHSAGKFLNNTEIVPMGRNWDETFENVVRYQEGFKFSIAFENANVAGYTTEKILQAFLAGSIPIYYGNPKIGQEINVDAFINCNDYDDLDEVVKAVKVLDKDDTLYKEKLKKNRFVFNEEYLSYQEEKELTFLRNIFSQEPQKAIRRVYGHSQRKKDYAYQCKWGMNLFTIYYKLRTLISKIRHRKK